MSRTDLPEIIKLSERLAAAIERAVAHAPRAYRYTHGSVIRLRAMDVWESAIRAWRRRDQQAARVTHG